MSPFKKGNTSWNKGKTNVYSRETLEKMSKARIGKTSWNKGISMSEESKKKLSVSHKGLVVWNKGTKGLQIAWNKGTKGLQIAWNKGISMSEESKKKLSVKMKGKVSSRKGAKLLEISKLKISKSRIERGVAKREKNPAWKGGISFGHYSLDWNKSLKENIRKRDRYTCQLCGKLQSNRLFCVHHIDYDKKNCNPTNLITLCLDCHLKTNINREFWKSFFLEKN